MQLDQLRALLAVVDEGTFEAAAGELGVTPSAVSQRIKALERSLGLVVVRREVPCVPTEAGAELLRVARQVQVIEADARRVLGIGEGWRTRLPVAVNADSLATWFRPVLAAAAEWPDLALVLHVEDEDHTAELLRRGEVLAAVTTDPTPVGGCRTEGLGSMRYHPVATPELRARWTRGGRPDWARMPVVRFNAKDDMQHALLRARGVGPADRRPGGDELRLEASGAVRRSSGEMSGANRSGAEWPGAERARGAGPGAERSGGAGPATEGPPVHVVPSSEGFVAAVRAGLGWGMLPDHQLGDALHDGSLVRLASRAHTDVSLYWQAWRLESPSLVRLTASVAHAARSLRPVRS